MLFRGYGLLLELWGEVRGVVFLSLLPPGGRCSDGLNGRRLGVMCAARVPRLLAALESVTREDYWAPELHVTGSKCTECCGASGRGRSPQPGGTLHADSEGLMLLRPSAATTW